MWTAFVCNNPPYSIYFIEGDNLKETADIVWSIFGRTVSEFHCSEYLTQLLGQFNITDGVFTEHHTDPMYFKRGKELIPATQRSVRRTIDGEYCRMCHEFYSMAVGNQQDGSLVCWVCRDSNRWMFN